MDKPSELVGPKLKVYSGNGVLEYFLGAFDPESYRNNGKRILSLWRELQDKGLELQVLTGSEIALFVRDLYHGANKDEKLVMDVRTLFRERWFWVYNCNRWVDRDKRGPKGVYVVPDREALGLNLVMDPNILERKLRGVREEDGLRVGSDGVRFAVEGSYTLGKVDKTKFAQNGFVRATFLPEGAKLMAEVASSFENIPTIHGWKIKNQESIQTVSTLDVYLDGLRVGGSISEDIEGGYSFSLINASARNPPTLVCG